MNLSAVPRLSPRLLAATLVLASIALISGACGESNSSAPSQADSSTQGSQDPASQAVSYTVRAQVTRINQRADPPLLHVHHEPIHDFIGPSGEVEGMDSMVMPFPLADGISFERVLPDDLIEIDLAVDWSAVLPARITAIRALPDGTVLDFGQAAPASE